MSQLRKEYKEFKQIQEQNFIEAAEAWTEENVILINERLNRNAIYRLNTAIQRFDNKFGKYRDKLPAIARILDNAENGLQLVITGKVGSRTTAHMLQRMSIMYNILSNFFGGDLGALLKTPAFRTAHEQPDEKIDKIIDRAHDVKSIRRNLAAALKPSDEERTIFRKAYKTFEMPTLDWNMAAKQLCCLSCNELKDLAGIEKVPMVVIDEKPEAIETENGMDEANIGQSFAGAYNTGSRAVGRAWNFTGKVAPPALGAAVGGGIGLGAAGISALVGRFQSRSKEMTAAITKLENYVKGVEGFNDVEKALGQLREKSKTAAQTKFDLSAGVRGLLRHPSVVVMKQAVMATEAVESVIKAWNEHIKETYKNGIKPEDLPKIKKELTSKVKGGVLSRIKGAVTGVKPFPGLSPDDIINAVMKVASEGVVEQKGVEAPASPPSGAAPAAGAQESIIVESFNIRNQTLFELHQMVSEMMLTEDYQDLEKLITQLGTFEKSKEGNAETAVEKDLQTAAKTATTATQPAATPPQGKAAPAKTGETTNVQPPSNPQQAATAAQQIAKEAEATAQQDPGFDPEDLTVLNGSIDILNKSLSNPLNADFVKDINAQIAALKVPNVSDYNSARDLINQYKSIITADTLANTQKAVAMTIATIEKYMQQPVAPATTPAIPVAAPPRAVPPTPAPAAGPTPVQIQEEMTERMGGLIGAGPTGAVPRLQESKNKKINDRRQLLVEKLKKIILEQLDEATPPAAAPASVAATPTEEVLSVEKVLGANVPMIDVNVVNQFNSYINSLEKLDGLTKLNVKAALDTKLGTYGIKDVKDLASFQQYFKTYQNIMTHAQNIRKIMSIINKTANVIYRAKPGQKFNTQTGQPLPGVSPSPAPAQQSAAK